MDEAITYEFRFKAVLVSAINNIQLGIVQFRIRFRMHPSIQISNMSDPGINVLISAVCSMR